MAKSLVSHFSAWMHWGERNDHAEIRSPGIYAISRFLQPPVRSKFGICEQIIYFGMTNSVGGLRYRLKQFDRTIAGYLEHGGADRVRHAFPSYARLVPKLYVAVAPFPCDVKSNLAVDLRVMGEVARFEYMCLAAYSHKWRCLPRFNDKRASPKFSANEN